MLQESKWNSTVVNNFNLRLIGFRETNTNYAKRINAGTYVIKKYGSTVSNQFYESFGYFHEYVFKHEDRKPTQLSMSIVWFFNVLNVVYFIFYSQTISAWRRCGLLILIYYLSGNENIYYMINNIESVIGQAIQCILLYSLFISYYNIMRGNSVLVTINVDNLEL